MEEALYLLTITRAKEMKIVLYHKRLPKYRSVVLLACLVWPMSLGQDLATEAYAVTIYSYIDDQGTPVYTDRPETIPDKYRARVTTHERPDPGSNPDSKSPSMMESVKQTVKERAGNVKSKLTSFQFDIEGLSPVQSKILTYAGAATVVLLLMMYLSKSQLVRLLGFSLLIAIGIVVPLLLYVNDGGSIDTMKDAMKKKVTASGQAQQDRLPQTPQ